MRGYGNAERKSDDAIVDREGARGERGRRKTLQQVSSEKQVERG